MDWCDCHRCADSVRGACIPLHDTQHTAGEANVLGCRAVSGEEHTMREWAGAMNVLAAGAQQNNKETKSPSWFLILYCSLSTVLYDALKKQAHSSSPARHMAWTFACKAHGLDSPARHMAWTFAWAMLPPNGFAKCRIPGCTAGLTLDLENQIINEMGVKSCILDSSRVLHPTPSVLGAQSTSQIVIIGTILERGLMLYMCDLRT